jgi:hypothetical protein
MKRLILNADDFGMTRGINEGIVRAHQKGILTKREKLYLPRAEALLEDGNPDPIRGSAHPMGGRHLP